MPVKVLVADDEAEVRFLLVLCLEQGGFEVVTAGDGEEALGRSATSVRRLSSSTSRCQASGASRPCPR